MHIKHFAIENYKSYRAKAEIEFQPGFNVITGQNSAGKTSLLEALSLNSPATPHRSPETIPAQGGYPPSASISVIQLVIDTEEMRNLLRSYGNPILLPNPVTSFRLPNGLGPGSAGFIQQFIEWFLSRQQFRISVRRTIALGNNQEVWNLVDAGFAVYEPEPLINGRRTFITFRTDQSGGCSAFGVTTADENTDASVWLAQSLRQRIYRFFAERFNTSQSGFGSSTILAQNAQNLPEVLLMLQANHHRFQQLNDLMHEILPQIRQVSVLPLGGNLAEIKIWPHDPATEREDLALPLSQCGSGIGQVLAMLYVVLTAAHPQVILIDEPQSLLHPGATRKLIEVLKRYPQHQYILATHSPTVITAANPATVTVAKLEGMETRLQSIDTRKTQDLQLYLADIGARLSDVFGADSILWVEGQTEELSFPIILSQLAHRSLMGIAIVGIRQTGELEGRDAKRVFELYRRLSGATALLPPALAFVLDRECRSQALRDDLQRESHGKTLFLPRRMFENYLLNATGIAEVANVIEGFRAVPLTANEVLGLIEAKRQHVRHFCPGTIQVPGNWIVEIDGAKVLAEIFSELSENRVSYDKVRHSVALVKWIVANAPEELQEVVNLLNAIVPP